ALSQNGRQLGFREQRDAAWAHPNRRGTGPWRVFDLEKREWAEPKNFEPLGGLDSAGGWTVQPSDKDPYVWYAGGPDERRHTLALDRGQDGLPRCYSFLPAREGKPVRLAVGHYWGLSLFELSDKAARRTRVYMGHQGEVMSLAVSADQSWLVSASTDQT